MLDVDTKRRIDTARDILVGKVPDPKSQVEQITIALIYKFMDDMDTEAEELGGRRKFFAGDFSRYGWAKLLRSGLGGQEILNLYAESITKMTENPGIPPLFRDIFKNAYLPYRDPETLRAFLKIIDEFTYDHSERLGDAFEYLLSVLSSQGDAGQFRTPRHIIDFIVEIIDPKKNETILDPACGTAGFLISSYKHILRANTHAKGHITLTNTEKGRLAKNIKGYDISPDMVRLSLVNLYLHGFSNPQIHEYDTLTSQDRWTDFADVILANPPFMTPKGGIKPHKRFSVQSKRSEVLFVDYMAEHLTPAGRAGIIVPEGIIFQSQSAYKTLRKMLVENYLVAVVSLPAGVFNPYSGVKTSILIFDKTLSRQSDVIAFFKVENDGFDLGAQRRPIDKNDLPQALSEITEYLRRLRARESLEDFEPELGLIVEKEKIAANGDYNLSGERYREVSSSVSLFPMIEIGKICKLFRGLTYAKEDEVSEGGNLVLRANNINKDHSALDLTDIKRISARLTFSDEKKLQKHDILICLASGSKDHIGKVALIMENTNFYFGGFMGAVRCNQDLILPAYLYHQLTSIRFNDYLRDQISGANINNLNSRILNCYQIPLPPLEVQKAIVEEIEGYQKVIDGARQVVENYKPRIDIDPAWPMVELGEVCSLGGSITTDVNLTLPYIGADSIESHTGKILKIESAGSQNVSGPIYKFSGKRLLYSKIRPYLNKLTVVDLKGYCSSDMYPLVPDPTKVHITYLTTYMLSDRFNEQIRGYYERASIPKINRSQLFGTEIPLPPLATQKAIVAEIEAEQALVAANRELIERFEKKIQAVLARVWGEEG